MDRLAGLEIFIEVVRQGSFTGAARSLGVSKSFVSKEIRRLEDRLGARLLNRTTRKVQVTEVGRAFFDRCTTVLEELEEAAEAVASMQSTPRGTLRVTVPMSFGVKWLTGPVAEFMSAWPELNVDLQFNDRKVDIIEEGFDMAIRIGELEDSSLIARKLARNTMHVVASPAYLKDAPPLVHPKDLRQHKCLLYDYLRSNATWRFKSDEGEASVRVSGPLQTNNGDAIVAAARFGVGVGLAPDFLVNEALRSGELVEVLPEWSAWRGAIWALYPHSRHLSAKVRLFVDALVERFQPVPPWSSDA